MRVQGPRPSTVSLETEEGENDEERGRETAGGCVPPPHKSLPISVGAGGRDVATRQGKEGEAAGGCVLQSDVGQGPRGDRGTCPTGPQVLTIHRHQDDYVPRTPANLVVLPTPSCVTCINKKSRKFRNQNRRPQRARYRPVGRVSEGRSCAVLAHIRLSGKVKKRKTVRRCHR